MQAEIPSPDNENRFGRFARARLDRFLSTRTVLTAVQSIVDLETSKLVGHELLARPLDTATSMTARKLLKTAESQGLAADLCRRLRRDGVEKTAGRVVPGRLFLNAHPAELSQPNRFVDSMRELREGHSEIDLTVEIPENAPLDLDAYVDLREQLRALRIGVAFDEFGTGRSRLLEMAAAPPEYVKFSRPMIHGIDQQVRFRKRVLSRVLEFIHSLGSIPIAVGVESQTELTTCRDLGFSWAQGFFVGRPWTVAA